jgi:poly(3-hydroxybutyrate) depolymerase
VQLEGIYPLWIVISIKEILPLGKVTKALAALALGAVTAYLFTRRKDSSLPVGESSYFLEDRSGTCGEPIPVYYYKPATWTEDQPVFIAFPGYTRKAERFEKHLEELAVRYNMLIACPEFSTKKYPGARWYQEGNISDAEGEKGTIQPRQQWTFDAIDHVTGAVRRRTHAKGKVILFGHSAGGQLMHRYSLFASHPAADAIVCANAGWFTMPDESVCYPYGIKNVPLSDRDLARAFTRPVIMLMGGNDISREKPFRDTPEADAQGMNRMERCNNYFHFCEAKAAELGVPFRWQLHVVEGAAHEGGKMAEGAMKLFCQEPLDETVGM